MNEKKVSQTEKELLNENGERSDAKRKTSGTAQRSKSLKTVMTELLNSRVENGSIFDSAAEMGVDKQKMNYRSAIAAALVKKAASGDVSAFKEIRSLIGEDINAQTLKIKKRELAIKEAKSSPDKSEKSETAENAEGMLCELIEGLRDDDIYE